MDERGAQIAVEHIRDIGEQLLGQRAIQPESTAQRCVVGGIPVLPPEGDRRIARSEVDEAGPERAVSADSEAARWAYRRQKAPSAKSPVQARKPEQRAVHARVFTVSTSQ